MIFLSTRNSKIKLNCKLYLLVEKGKSIFKLRKFITRILINYEFIACSENRPDSDWSDWVTFCCFTQIMEKYGYLLVGAIPSICVRRDVFNALFYLVSIQEKSGKIVKEVTETTTLRVSHDTRLGIASYKVISNTTQDHRENVDVKEIKDLERIVFPDVQTNGLHHETGSGCKCETFHVQWNLITF